MNSEKVIIIDSGPLISFSMAGLLPELRELKRLFNGKFLITEEVKYEVVNRPINIKRFELEAMKVQEMLNDKILEMPLSIGIKDSDIQKEMKKFVDIANNTFSTSRGPVNLIHYGEASCLALSRILTEKGIDNIIAIDERTTRLLGEKPENLKKILQGKLHTAIKENVGNYRFFKGFRFIRSTELIYVAYKKGIVKLKNKDVLDALLYALKFKGVAISDDEISDIKKIG